MINELKQKIESNRQTKNIFWIFLVLIKDLLWFLSEKFKNISSYIFGSISNYLVSFFNFFSSEKYNFDVDVVYVYANGNDPDFLKQKSALLKKMDRNDPLLKESTAPNRFNDYGELKYSLRSVISYAPWIRNIYIVTSTPNIKWLNLDTDQKNIFIISHESVFPSIKCLPNFNASSIEMFLDKIPGLAEHFIYFNDDTFLGGNVSKSDFFTSNGECLFNFKDNFYYQEKENFRAPRLYQPLKTKHAIELIMKKYARTRVYEPIHQVRPVLKSVFSTCKNDFLAECNKTSMNKFRSADDISLINIIFPSYAIYNNFGRVSNKFILNHAFILLSDNLIINELRLERLINKKPKLFCLGDDTSFYNNEVQKQIDKYLQEYFPLKSEFEV